eukprot:497531-Pyramimonas_sp.AAC.1
MAPPQYGEHSLRTRAILPLAGATGPNCGGHGGRPSVAANVGGNADDNAGGAQVRRRGPGRGMVTYA